MELLGTLTANAATTTNHFSPMIEVSNSVPTQGGGARALLPHQIGLYKYVCVCVCYEVA